MIEERMVAQPFGPAAAFVLTDHQVDAIGGGSALRYASPWPIGQPGCASPSWAART